MAAACGITVIKRFTYRGNATEEYSNTYWLTGAAPSTDASWRALFDAIVLTEKAIYPSGTVVARGYGYNDDTGHKPGDEGAVAPAVYVLDLVAAAATVPGTLVVSGLIANPGDTAVWARWKTSRVTSPGGKAIYVRKYYHPTYSVSSGSPDTVLALQRTALLAHAAKLWDGTLNAASQKITTCGRSDVIVGANASTYITTRTLKRRGKRPNS